MIVALTLLACGGSTAPNPDPPPAAEVFHFEPAEPAHQVVRVSLLGQVVGAPDAHVELGTREEARIERWLVEPGAPVIVGQPLARLSSPALDALLDERRQRRAVRDQAAARQVAGVSSGLEQLEAAASLSALDARAAALAPELTRDAQGWTWRSPVDAQVAALRCEPGAQVGPRAPCVALRTDADVRVVIDVPDRFLAGLAGASGQLWLPDHEAPIELRWGADAPALEPISRTRRTWLLPVASQSTPPDALLPGRAGRVDVRVPAPDGAVAVPRRAVTRLGGEDVVYRAPDAAVTPVALLGERDGAVVVHSPQLRAGDGVLTRGVLVRTAQLTLDEEAE